MKGAMPAEWPRMRIACVAGAWQTFDGREGGRRGCAA